jgi:hypothetical protein
MEVLHWLIVLVVMALIGVRRFSGGGSKGGPPTHPLPVSNPIETANDQATVTNQLIKGDKITDLCPWRRLR